MTDIECSNCHKLIPDDSLFCSHCGFKIDSQKDAVEKPIACPNCGKSISETSLFCPYCGYKIFTVKELIKCPHCKSKILEDVERCPDCGFKMAPEIMVYDGNLKQCPNCRKNITKTSQKCSYCGFDFTYKNINNLHIIWCPKCKTDILSTSEKCYDCGYRLKPERDTEDDGVDVVGQFDNIGNWLKIGFALVAILVIFKICKPASDSREATPSYSRSNRNETNYTGKYIINTDVTFAGTSKENFDMMINCVSNNDMQALEVMVLSGQIKYLHKNDVVYLVKSRLTYAIVRPTGSTEQLYVNIEFITPQ
jgi:DNA-directed RNA polymerase subunit RPC12/RpoP